MSDELLRDFSTLKRTTVAQLKQMLDDLPDDAPVFLHGGGGDGGYDDVLDIVSIELTLNKNREGFAAGSHDLPEDHLDHLVHGVLIRPLLAEYVGV